LAFCTQPLEAFWKETKNNSFDTLPDVPASAVEEKLEELIG
jgi:hypothetical protein